MSLNNILIITGYPTAIILIISAILYMKFYKKKLFGIIGIALGLEMLSILIFKLTWQ